MKYVTLPGSSGTGFIASGTASFSNGPRVAAGSAFRGAPRGGVTIGGTTPLPPREPTNNGYSRNTGGTPRGGGPSAPPYGGNPRSGGSVAAGYNGPRGGGNHSGKHYKCF